MIYKICPCCKESKGTHGPTEFARCDSLLCKECNFYLRELATVFGKTRDWNHNRSMMRKKYAANRYLMQKAVVLKIVFKPTLIYGIKPLESEFKTIWR